MIQAIAPQDSVLDNDTIQATLHAGLEGQYSGQKVLILIPDHTRTIPLPFLFRQLVQILHDTKQLDFMVALGTHPPLSDEQLRRLVGITKAEQAGVYQHIGLLNHAWESAETLTQIATLTRDQIRELAGDKWHFTLGEDVPVKINCHIYEYDHLIILGPTFPHEVAGFSGGVKYLFPGISGPEMINVSHWLGALVGVVDTIGVKQTPVRAMFSAAAAQVAVPVSLIALVVVGKAQLAGLFIDDVQTAWSAAADLSAQRHIVWVDKPFQRILSWAPPMYDELWTAGKAMYKLEPALAKGGELIIYAPHLATVSHVHGRYIYETGYHVLDYFLKQWEQFKHIPLGVLAHSTHVRGSGYFKDGVEYPNVTVGLATQLSQLDCQQLALKYINPDDIMVDQWQGLEEQGTLFVPKAGEMLYKVREQKV